VATVGALSSWHAPCHHGQSGWDGENETACQQKQTETIYSHNRARRRIQDPKSSLGNSPMMLIAKMTQSIILDIFSPSRAIPGHPIIPASIQKRR
jgi:hypothetical protein